VREVFSKTFRTVLFVCMAAGIMACDNKPKKQYTPWGTEMTDSITVSDDLSLQDLQRNGEIIVLTMSGPATYYEYHGRGLGVQYLLANRFAQTIGVKVRVDLCTDTTEMVRRLASDEADIMLLSDDSTANINIADTTGIRRVPGMPWYCRASSDDLYEAIVKWYRPGLVASVKNEEKYALSAKAVVRTVYSPILNSSGGVISKWDSYFKKAGATLRWDWRLIAAQCYQESCFDPKAKSWAGASGLMQIMPTTADHLGLPRSQLFDPVANITAATKYLVELNSLFLDVRDSRERIWFVLASYNGGPHHIRDAMALAQKYGRNKYSWAEVSRFVLKLMEPEYYRDPVVKCGYMRGSETADYVVKIRQRWQSYSGIRSNGNATPFQFKGKMKTPKGVHQPPVINNDFRTPKEAKRKNKYAK